MVRAIIHVDMDAFYASVEIRERPELRGCPVVVGGTPEGRGVVAAASYEARRFGIHSAMPAAAARRLCPQAVFLPPRHDFYAEVSRSLHGIFRRYTPQVEPLALDEAFLDVTGSLRLFGSAAAMGRRIKEEIRSELKLVASVGVGPNKFIAKLASDARKPDGFVVVEPDGVQPFLDPQAITRLWGVGQVTARVFERLGIRTIGQFRQYSPHLLRQHLGNATDHLWALAHGRDERPVIPDQEAKSVSNETTFARDISDTAALRAWLRELAEQVARRLRKQGLRGRTIQLKVRFADFTTLTRSQSLAAPTDTTAEITRVAEQLFMTRLPTPRPPVRLIGVGVGGFDEQNANQFTLFDSGGAARARAVDSVVDAIKDRFGVAALRRGKGPPGYK